VRVKLVFVHIIFKNGLILFQTKTKKISGPLYTFLIHYTSGNAWFLR